jgi:putative ABC transport system permease protein
VALLSDSFWRRHFAADPDILNKTIRLGDDPFTIVGVLAPGLEPPAEYSGTAGELWVPFGSVYTRDELAARGRHNWMVIGRLRPGVSPAQADGEMKSIGAALSREFPDTNEQVGAFVGPLRDHFVRSTRLGLYLLLGTVLFVLLIACANIANLLLSRYVARSREMAIRGALGAGGWEMVRQSLCESVILCAGGTALGIFLATTAFEWLARFAPGAVTGMKTLALDWRVMAFTVALASLTAAVFGLAPSFRVRRFNANEGLKQSARAMTASPSARRVGSALIAAEVALAFMLLVSAGLLIRSFARLRGVEPGCRTHDVLTLQVPGPERPLEPARLVAAQREVLRRIRALPGVESAGFTNHIPILFKGDISGVGVEGHDPKERIQCHSRVAGPGYFHAMGIPLVRGRDVEETDDDHAPYVVIINETLAQTAWPSQNPIGRRLIFETGHAVPVIGVVGDVRSAGLDVSIKPEFYVSSLQAGIAPGSLAIHTKVPATTLIRPVQSAIWAMNPDQPITDVLTIEEILNREVHGRRLQASLLAGFAGLALLLACIGLYGVLAYQVTQAIPEIGIRLALGAVPARVLRQTIGSGLRLTLAGLVLGVAGALATSRLIQSLLFDVTTADVSTYVLITAIMLVTAALASYIPARRAMRVDPISALRNE